MTTTILEHSPITGHESQNSAPFTLPEETLTTLRDLAKSDRSTYDDLLEDIAVSYLTEHVPAFLANVKKMRTSRMPDEQQEIKRQQQQLMADTRRMIAYAYDLPWQSALEEARDTIANVVEAAGGQSPLEASILAKLGIIANHNGNSWYHYPYGLFPTEVDTAWSRYLRAADDHEKYAGLLKKGAGKGLHELVMEKDHSRRSAHNTLAGHIQHLFGLAHLDDARELATKMRDHTPLTSRADDNAATGPNRLSPGMTVARSMRHHLLPGYDSLPDPERPRHF